MRSRLLDSPVRLSRNLEHTQWDCVLFSDCLIRALIEGFYRTTFTTHKSLNSNNILSKIYRNITFRRFLTSTFNRQEKSVK